MRYTVSKECQCEHIAHFVHEELTPNGNPGHKHGTRVYTLIPIKTEYGIFMVCEDCAQDCLLDYLIKD